MNDDPPRGLIQPRYNGGKQEFRVTRVLEEGCR